MERPEYVCGSPTSRQTSSVTKYLNPAADTLWCASSTRGLAFNLGSLITLLMRSSTTGAILYTPPSLSYRGECLRVAWPLPPFGAWLLYRFPQGGTPARRNLTEVFSDV